MPLAPIVTDSVREYLPVAVESTPRDRLLHKFGRLHLGAGILVPETERTVRAYGGESSVHRMKRNVINGIYVLIAIGGAVRAVALKSEVVFRVGRVDILNGDATFNGTESVACRLFLFVSGMEEVCIV